MTSNVDSWSPWPAAIATKGIGPAETPVDGIRQARECPEAGSGARSACSRSQSHEPFGLMQLKAGLCILQSAACIKFWSLHVAASPEPSDLSLSSTPMVMIGWNTPYLLA